MDVSAGSICVTGVDGMRNDSNQRQQQQLAAIASAHIVNQSSASGHVGSDGQATASASGDNSKSNSSSNDNGKDRLMRATAFGIGTRETQIADGLWMIMTRMKVMMKCR